MLISFVIPVYNAKAYLVECVNSILKQDKQEFAFEVILIDDGSSDGSEKICDELALDARVHTFHRINAGVSSARNFGISQAQGDYICFVDADDYLLPDSLAAINKELQEHKADYYLFPFVKEVRVGVLEEQRYANQGKILDMETACRYFYLDGKNGPWSKLFNRAIIEKYHLAFDKDLKIHEDVLFCMGYLEHCTSVRYCETPFYFYRLNGTGAVQKHKKEYLDNYEVVYTRWSVFLKAHHLDGYLDALNSQFLYKYVITSAKLMKYGASKKEISSMLEANEVCNSLIEKKYKSIKDTVLAHILKHRFFALISRKVK